MSLAVATSPEPIGPQDSKRPRSPRATKPASRQQTQPAEKPRKVSFYLSAEALQRLGVHATMEGRDKSSLVDELCKSLRRYDLPRRRGADATLMPGESAES